MRRSNERAVEKSTSVTSLAKSNGKRRATIAVRSRRRKRNYAPWRSMNSSVRRHASAEASANSSYLRSKKLCGCALVRHDLVLDACRGQRFVERGVVLGGDVRVVAGLQREDRRVELGGALRRPGHAAALGGHPVEADRAGEAVASGRGEPGVAAAEAEPDGEDGGRAAVAQIRDRRRDVRLNPSGVVCCTCSIHSKSSSRLLTLQCGRSSRSRRRRSRARRSATRAPRRSGRARGRPAG